MTEQEYIESQRDAIEFAIMLSEIKKSDPQISERLKWILEGIKIATGSKNKNQKGEC